MKKSSLLVTAIGLSIPFGLSLPASAATSTWTGAVDNNYTTEGNWDPSGVPDLANANTAIINSGTVTRDGDISGDFTVQNGGVLQLNGGSFTHIGSGDWMQVHTGGTVNVAGGSFNQGTSPVMFGMNGTFNVSAGSATFNEFQMADGGLLNLTGGTSSFASLANATGATISIGGGAASMTGNYTNTAGSFTLTSGSFSLGTAEFKPLGGSVSMSGGTLSAKLISFDASAGVFDFYGGNINLDGGGGFYIFADTTGHVNFGIGSTGVLTLANYTVPDAMAFITNGKIQWNNTIDPSKFQVIDSGGSAVISLVSVPEPSTYAAIIGLACFGLIYLRRRNQARAS